MLHLSLQMEHKFLSHLSGDEEPPAVASGSLVFLSHLSGDEEP